MYKQNRQQIRLDLVGGLYSEGYNEYPYYPIVATIEDGATVYLAVKHGLGFYIQQIPVKERTLKSKPYMVTCDGLPENNPITAMEFVRKEVMEINMGERYGQIVDQKSEGVLFLLLGFSSGHLCLVFIRAYKGRVIQRFNKSDPKGQSNIFSKTLSRFMMPQESTSYPVWQKFGVLKITSRKSLTYLLRNNIIVHTYSLLAKFSELQRKFQSVMNNPLLANNQVAYWQGKKSDICCSAVADAYKQVWDQTGFILAFNFKISNYLVQEKSFYVSTFEGLLYVFDRITLMCVQKVTTTIAIRHIFVHNDIVTLCLQDDSVELVKLNSGQFIKINGHKSFVSQTSMWKGYLVVSSFDGYLSFTRIPPPSQWMPAYSLQTSSRSRRQFRINQWIKVGRGQSGIGAFHIVQNFLVCALQDDTIQVYHFRQ